jgi:uncharacterized protein with HEPN domain
VHDYFGFNLETAWKVAAAEVPLLAAQLALILVTEFSGGRAGQEGP